MSAARCQNKIRLDFVIFRLNLHACRIKNSNSISGQLPFFSLFLMSNVSLFTRRVINSWKTIQSCRSAQIFSMKRHVTWGECDFQGGWTPSLPICQCVSEVRGEFLCVLVWFWLVLCEFLGRRVVDSPYASRLIVVGWLSRVFIKESREVERAEWMKAVSTPVREQAGLIQTLTHTHTYMLHCLCQFVEFGAPARQSWHGHSSGSITVSAPAFDEHKQWVGMKIHPLYLQR